MCATLAAAGCSSAGKQADPLAFQKEGMAATDPKKIGALAPGSEEEKRAIARFKDFFSVWNEENIRKKIKDTYAADLYFNDTLKSVRDVKELEAYMVRGAQAVDSCTVEYLDVLSKDGEYYFHWRMDILFKKFRKGKLQSSYGISHIRFDKDGKVVYHQDYWDAAGNFFEKIPLLGAGIRFIKRQL
ncbi:MAG TPA: nuclear transport factor 2 family protein [Elusimicrobiota bacterium]|jgi:hypothetical protein|nr:nuclear transport factor 2 family protein [Elusimicrobiota bacterium]